MERSRFLSNVFVSLVLVALLFSFAPKSVHAIEMAGEYTLPYPSAMPGGFPYKINQLVEKIHAYWYFGNFAQFDYHLQTADKYLVQAKTLFEYKQYLLADQALQKSNEHFSHLQPLLTNAVEEGKNVSVQKDTLKKASAKHVEVLTALKKETPKSFNWSPEKTAASYLEIHDALDAAIKMRDASL